MSNSPRAEPPRSNSAIRCRIWSAADAGWPRTTPPAGMTRQPITTAALIGRCIASSFRDELRCRKGCDGETRRSYNVSRTAKPPLRGDACWRHDAVEAQINGHLSASDNTAAASSGGCYPCRASKPPARCFEEVAYRVFDAGKRKPQNQPVRRALSIIAGLVFALAGATVASVCLAPIDFALVHGCAPTTQQAPAPSTGRSTCHDDARMVGEAIVPASGERSTFQSVTALAAATIASGTDRFGAVTALRSASFIRPHDPSHLHTFVLLI